MYSVQTLRQYLAPHGISQITEGTFSLLSEATNRPMLGIPATPTLDKIAIDANLEDKEVCSRLLYKNVSYVHKNGTTVEFHQSGRFPVSSFSIQIYGTNKERIQIAENDLKKAFKTHLKYVMFPCRG